MDKIWIVYNKGSYKKKYKIYKTEADMVKNVSNTSTSTILEYELKSSNIASDYFKSKERDTQLRTILGELSKESIDILTKLNINLERSWKYLSDMRDVSISNDPLVWIITERDSLKHEKMVVDFKFFNHFKKCV